jgi:hypothetical protein
MSSQRTTKPARSTTAGRTISSFIPVPLKDGRDDVKKIPIPAIAAKVRTAVSSGLSDVDITWSDAELKKEVTGHLDR